MLDDVLVGLFVIGLGVIIICFIGFLFWFFPIYGVWEKELSGKAQLKEAEWSKKIKIEEAIAEKESATLLKDAEIIRATGVAESTKIISEELEKNQSYLQYLAIQAQMKMAESPNHTTIYIPVGNNGIPIIKDVNE